jgi:hypothetical protein
MTLRELKVVEMTALLRYAPVRVSELANEAGPGHRV